MITFPEHFSEGTPLALRNPEYRLGRSPDAAPDPDTLLGPVVLEVFVSVPVPIPIPVLVPVLAWQRQLSSLKLGTSLNWIPVSQFSVESWFSDAVSASQFVQETGFQVAQDLTRRRPEARRIFFRSLSFASGFLRHLLLNK